VRALTLHGTDLHNSRTRVATRAVLPLIDVLAATSDPLARELPARHARAGRVQVLPCGVDLERFRPLARQHARAELGLRPGVPYLLFPADPSRSEKHHERALALARSLQVELLALGAVDPLRVPLWVNAANAVLVPSEREGFGLAVLEALACDVPVLATPVGIHPSALRDVDGTLCAPFELASWRAALEPHLRVPDPRVDGRWSAERFSAQKMAERVACAWRAALERSG
jgi:glycosyltransferase involved in cell wall biosynthesis